MKALVMRWSRACAWRENLLNKSKPGWIVIGGARKVAVSVLVSM